MPLSSSSSPRRRRARVLAALCLLGLAAPTYLALRHPASECTGKEDQAPSSSPRGASPATTSQAPRAPAAEDHAGLWQAFETARRTVQPLTPEEAALPNNEGVTAFSYHPAQGLSARYANDGVRISGQSGTWQARFHCATTTAATWQSSGTRAELKHGDGVTEWFENRSEGIEHGFIVDHASSNNPGALLIDVHLDGLTATPSEDPESLALLTSDGSPKLKYSGLKVWDANGSTLTASMSPSADGIAIQVDDRGAHYPITIDPLITSLEQTLRPTVLGTGSSGDRFGASLAVDGNAAVIGAPSDATAAGAASGSVYVFERTNGHWLSTAILNPDPDSAGDAFGSAVAISGNVAVIGAPSDGVPDQTLYTGSAYVFVRTAGTWSKQARLADATSKNYDSFGWRVAVNGSTVAIAGKRYTGPSGVYVYVQNGAAWDLQQFLKANVYNDIGRSISIEGDTLVAGATSGANFNHVLVFTRSAGTWSGPVGIAGPGSRTDFGVATDLDGDTLLIGAPTAADGVVETGLAYVYTRNGTDWTMQQKIVPNGGVAGDAFGSAVALAGDVALIGQSGADLSSVSDVGAVNVYRRTGGVWNLASKTLPETPANSLRLGTVLAFSGDQLLCGLPAAATPAGTNAGAVDVYTLANGALSRQDRLTAGDDSVNENFGQAVAIDGDTVAIGAGRDTTARGVESGSAYVFTRSGSTWTQQAKLDAFDGSGGMRFGTAVAVNGGTLIVGAPYDLNPPVYSSAGSAYAYVRNGSNWSLQEKLYADEMEYGLFGSSIALDGDTAVIGAPTRGNRHGSAYVFERSAGLWSQQATLEESPGQANAYFGTSLAIEGGTIVVGAPQIGLHPGVAHVFSRSGHAWNHQATLDGAGDLRFGSSVALSGNLALIGAPGTEALPDPLPASGTGAAHLFARSGTTWKRVDRFTPDNAAAVHRFGKSVAMDGNIALVGAEERYTDGPDSDGATYVFAREGVTWSRQDIIAGLPQGGSASALALSGDTAVVASATEDSVNPFNGLTGTDTGSVRIYRLSGLLASGPEASLLSAFDGDSDGSLSPGEWLALYSAPPKKEKLFALADADASGDITLAEFIAAKSNSATARTVDGWLSRTKVFLELDADDDGAVTRAEIALMWSPGGAQAPIDAFWSRLKGGSGINLKTWVQTKVLPNFATYEVAKATRAKRAAAAADLDLDSDGLITRAEFGALFPANTAATKIDAAWRAACGTLKNQVPPIAITIHDFIEAPKLPPLP